MNMIHRYINTVTMVTALVVIPLFLHRPEVCSAFTPNAISRSNGFALLRGGQYLERPTSCGRSSQKLNMAVCIGDLTTFSEKDLNSSSKNKASFTGFGKWYQTMDHRLARPKYYDTRFYTSGDEDWLMPSQRWPAMKMMENENIIDTNDSEQEDELHDDESTPTSRRRPYFAQFRRIVQWTLRRK